METLSDLKTFAKILTDKGYNGYFHTQGAYPGKLKDSIGSYLKSGERGTGSLPEQELLLTGYLRWFGDDQPRIICRMRVKYLNGKFFLGSMEIEKTERYGLLLKQSKLTNLSVTTAPKAADAIALVGDVQKEAKNSKRFKQ